MVAQLIPLELSFASPAEYQNSVVKILWMLSVSQIAEGLRMQIPKTINSVAAPQDKVMICLGILSMIIRANISTKITTAIIVAAILFTSFLFSFVLIYLYVRLSQKPYIFLQKSG